MLTFTQFVLAIKSLEDEPDSWVSPFAANTLATKIQILEDHAYHGDLVSGDDDHAETCKQISGGC